MISAVDPTLGVIIATLITAIVAPTWLSWWNTRQTIREFKPNGGSSVRDSLNRLETSVSATRQTALTLASVIGVAYFQTDEHGSYTYVSRDWQRLTSVFAEDALGSGWIEAIDQSDRHMISGSWHDAVREGRSWRAKCRLITGREIHMTANPIKSPSGAIEGYVGFFEVDDSTENALDF
jgi:PAS domain-containing protein